MGKRHMVTICVDSLIDLNFTFGVHCIVYNCDLLIYFTIFTITVIVTAAQERSSKPLALYFALLWLWIHILIRPNIALEH